MCDGRVVANRNVGSSAAELPAIRGDSRAGLEPAVRRSSITGVALARREKTGLWPKAMLRSCGAAGELLCQLSYRPSAKDDRAGLEPATCRVRGDNRIRSGPQQVLHTPGWSRTSGSCLRKAVLFPLSYGRETCV